MNPIFLKLGPLEIRYYGLMYALSFIIGLKLAKISAKEKNISEEFIEKYVMNAIIAGLIGGRLYYVIFNYKYYFKYPLEIPAVWHGGMAIHGAIIFGFLWSIIFAKINKVNFWIFTDIASPLLILGQAIGRFGNFMNGEIHGVPTFTPLKVIFSLKPKFYEWYNYYNSLSLSEQIKYKEVVPWGIVFPNTSPAGMEFPNIAVHPAMLYELILNFLAFLSLWFFFKKKNYKPGILTAIYLIEYSLIRSFVSFFRAEDLMFFGFRAPHVISFVLIVFATILIIIKSKKTRD